MAFRLKLRPPAPLVSDNANQQFDRPIHERRRKKPALMSESTRSTSNHALEPIARMSIQMTVPNESRQANIFFFVISKIGRQRWPHQLVIT